MKEEKCLGFLWEAEGEEASMCVVMHEKVVRASEQLSGIQYILTWDLEAWGAGAGVYQYH